MLDCPCKNGDLVVADRSGFPGFSSARQYFFGYKQQVISTSPIDYGIVHVQEGEMFIVLKARARFVCMQFVKPKCSKVLRLSDGEVFYIQRIFLKCV